MVDLQGARTLVILTRAPSSGGKSRLFRELGIAPDPALLEALLLDTLDGARGNGAAAQEVACLVAVTPADCLDEVAALVGGKAAVMPQGAVDPGGDLGARMAGAMRDAFARGAASVALLGSDLPHITPRHVDSAFAQLDRDPQSIVIGPADDGGYYLLAARHVPPVFVGPEWGSDRVLDDTRRLATAQDTRVHLIDPLADVDSLATLRAAAAAGARRCARWLSQHTGLPTAGFGEGG
jgi:rSAM/selenodomain-associated transferase 1